MKNTAIIIPTRLGAKRFPNKPLEKINNIPMIIHVLNRAKKSQVGEVFVATPDQKIFDIVKENNGQAIITKKNHISGSDRVYEVYENYLKQAMNILIAEDQGAIPLHSQYVVVGTTDKVDYTPRADEAFEVMLAKKAN